jgi:iron complex outermembrane receptor protein
MCKILLTAAILFMAFVSHAQNSISGIIFTKDGAPAPNVNVEVKELKRFSISTEDGSFTLDNLAEGTYHVVISYAGLLTQEQEIKVPQPQQTSRFILAENASQLEEVFINSRKG